VRDCPVTGEKYEVEVRRCGERGTGEGQGAA
jgi:predicted RNA-binding protein with TRAM domain